MKQAFTHYATSKQNSRRGFRIHLLVFLLGIPATWIIWLLTNSQYPWPIWSTISWSVGITFHYLGVFVFSKKN